MKKRNKIANIYTGVTVAVAIALAALKLCGLIGLSWWWVTAPIWVNLVLAVGLVVWANVYFKHLKDYE